MSGDAARRTELYDRGDQATDLIAADTTRGHELAAVLVAPKCLDPQRPVADHHYPLNDPDTVRCD